MGHTVTGTFQALPLDAVNLDDRKFDLHLPVEDVALAESVEQFGIMQPILVRRQGDEYTLLDGFQRIALCRRFSIMEIPAIIEPAESCDDLRALQLALSRNAASHRWSAADVAWLSWCLKERFQLSADVIGKSCLPLIGVELRPERLDEFIALAALPEDFLIFLAERHVSHTQLRPLLKLSINSLILLGQLVVRLQPGGQKIREAAELLFEISRRERRGDADILQDVMNALDDARTTSQQWAQMQEQLRNLRMPTWAGQQEEITGLIKSLELPGIVALHYPPYMEGAECECRIRFRTGKELAAAVDKLGRIADGDALKQLTEML
jgi:ParB-like chromosome segregation protein Spo0J